MIDETRHRKPTTEAVAARRRLKADRQQAYRDGKRCEVEMLQRQIHALEMDIRRLSASQQASSSSSRKSLLLPWQDVARALRDYNEAVVADHHSLKQQRQKHIDLILCLSAWVADATGTRVHTNPSGAWTVSNFLFSRTPLVAHPDARRHGLDWLTQVMLHHTDAMLDKVGFPSTWPVHGTSSADWAQHRLGDQVVDFSNFDNLNIVYRYMVDFSGPMERVVELVKEEYIDYRRYTAYTAAELEAKHVEVDHTDDETLVSIGDVAKPDDAIDLFSYVKVHTKGTSQHSHVLFRSFRPTPDRVVIAGQTIPQDERFVDTNRHSATRKVMTWYVFDRLSPTHTRLRISFLASHSTTAAGDTVPFDDEARKYGGVATIEPDNEETIVAKFKAVVANQGRAGTARADVAMAQVAAILRAESTTTLT
ncbi:Aste57867_22739 [Aphanomyces stellatus]|uniref:Aste57867_22739 protein n=1 Tax=Aphanomyces stellatus TaxID=120398 RepID=A0A485LLF4_9STRA|nr:hypothetical protein As57867_022669 [Aphanomyces stellatus]VFT99392.1 Aste57867_22739 [Aphanomyces stellatus]